MINISLRGHTTCQCETLTVPTCQGRKVGTTFREGQCLSAKATRNIIDNSKFAKEETTGVMQHEIEDNDIFIDGVAKPPLDLIQMGFKHMEFVNFIKSLTKEGHEPSAKKGNY